MSTTTTTTNAPRLFIQPRRCCCKKNWQQDANVTAATAAISPQIWQPTPRSRDTVAHSRPFIQQRRRRRRRRNLARRFVINNPEPSIASAPTLLDNLDPMKRTLKAFALSFIFAGIALVLLARVPLMENPLPPFSEKVTRSVETIFMIGRALGNHPDVFTRVGDSITVSHHFLYPIGDQNYQLGDHLYLQPVIDAFTRDSNAFAHRPITAGVGWAAWAPLSRTFTPPDRCAPAESPLVCEYR
ncbi:MAG: hypothetical protein JNJ78_07965, partial [Anaerolineae bacterium]|nr:hypothetical protein [Anaerolineae bacterium]